MPQGVPTDTVSAEKRPVRSNDFQFGHLSLAQITLAEAVDRITAMAIAEQPSVVVTSNIFHLMLAEVDARFQRVTRSCELNVADGWPLVAASRVLGHRLPERIAGVDLVEGLLNSQSRMRVAILGGAPGIADVLADRFRRNHDVVFVDPLEMGVWESPSYRLAMRERLEAASPNLVLVGIGAPKQEILADELRGSTKGPLIGCGQTINVLGGARARAPHLVQAVGLEWAFRTLMEPRRLGRRYLVAGWWYVRILRREIRNRRKGRAE
jgi:N-acetylglucosaminyldiphosphoundecaprenol N-acetyl-beta-D-mannosaminyltransferase